MSHVRGHWTETANPTFHCGLTARPAVSEKTLRPEPPSSSHFEWRLGPCADCLAEAPKPLATASPTYLLLCPVNCRHSWFVRRCLPSVRERGAVVKPRSLPGFDPQPWRDTGLCRPLGQPPLHPVSP